MKETYIHRRQKLDYQHIEEKNVYEWVQKHIHTYIHTHTYKDRRKRVDIGTIKCTWMLMMSNKQK